MKNCKNLNDNGSLVVMPKDKEIIYKDTGRKFTVEPKTFCNNYKKLKKLPVVIYADFECNLEPFIYQDKSKLCESDSGVKRATCWLRKRKGKTG